MSFILSLPNAATVIRMQIAVGILSGHAFSAKAKLRLRFPKQTAPRPQKGVLTFADTFPAFWPSFGPFFVGPAVFRKASVLLDGFVGDVFYQIGRLTIEDRTNLIQRIYWQMLNRASTDCGNRRRANTSFLCQILLSHLTNCEHHFDFELNQCISPPFGTVYHTSRSKSIPETKKYFVNRKEITQKVLTNYAKRSIMKTVQTNTLTKYITKGEQHYV